MTLDVTPCKSPQRIINLQKQVKLARAALEKIRHGCRDPEGVAETALYEMLPLDRVRPLAGLLGWEKVKP